MDALIIALINLKQDVQIAHWQSTNYANHTVLGNIYAELEVQLDKLVELSITIEPLTFPKDTVLKLQDVSDKEIMDVLVFMSQTFNEMPKQPKELENVLDDIRDVINQSIYLLRMK